MISKNNAAALSDNLSIFLDVKYNDVSSWCMREVWNERNFSISSHVEFNVLTKNDDSFRDHDNGNYRH